jgi:hypothetical protein
MASVSRFFIGGAGKATTQTNYSVHLTIEFRASDRCGFPVNMGPPAVGTSLAGGWHTTSSA